MGAWLRSRLEQPLATRTTATTRMKRTTTTCACVRTSLSGLLASSWICANCPPIGSHPAHHSRRRATLYTTTGRETHTAQQQRLPQALIVATAWLANTAGAPTTTDAHHRRRILNVPRHTQRQSHHLCMRREVARRRTALPALQRRATRAADPNTATDF